jgi:hypothetical protein
MTVLTLEMPTPPERDVVLVPNVRATRAVRRGGDEPPADALRPLERRISLGEPVFWRVDAESADDADLRAFFEQEGASYDFYAGRLTCTLREEGGDRFGSAVVDVELAAPEGASPSIAWSMEPVRSYDPVRVTRGLKVGPSLALLGIGMEAGAELRSERERREFVVEAFGEREPTPTWMLYRTPSSPLRGVHRFDLVVRAPKGARTLGNVALSATLERKRFGLLVYRGEFPGSPEATFELSRRVDLGHFSKAAP